MLILKPFLRIGEQDWREGKWLQTHNLKFFLIFITDLFHVQSLKPVLQLSINYKCYEGEHMNFLDKSLLIQNFHICEM